MTTPQFSEANGRVAWITGAGKGIGRAVARQLAAQGWTVAVSARTVADLESLAAACASGRIRPYRLDVTDPSATITVLDAIEAEVGRLDLAILNAGTHQPESAAKFSVETTRKLVEVNLMGTVNGLAPLVERFASRRKGHIAVVASLAGYRGLPSAAAYGATKAALINMCEALKPELEEMGVNLSLINPGFVETPLTDKNEFPMPFLISADRAASAIISGLAAKRFEIAVPWRFAVLMKLLRTLPDAVHFALTRRMVNQ
ncbi:MAG: SDR family NAD(P)-dependent oxidoreductase [Rhodospirillales bacterium]